MNCVKLQIWLKLLLCKLELRENVFIRSLTVFIICLSAICINRKNRYIKDFAQPAVNQRQMIEEICIDRRFRLHVMK